VTSYWRVTSSTFLVPDGSQGALFVGKSRHAILTELTKYLQRYLAVCLIAFQGAYSEILHGQVGAHCNANFGDSWPRHSVFWARSAAWRVTPSMCCAVRATFENPGSLHAVAVPARAITVISGAISRRLITIRQERIIARHAWPHIRWPFLEREV
jgi:hypothetical protein